MEGILKVTPEKLSATAQDFSGQATQVNNTTTEMMELVQGLSAVWQGEASQAYLTKFQGLQDDMEKMFRMIQEHSTDLQEMSDTYRTAESSAEQAIQTLSSEVIV